MGRTTFADVKLIAKVKSTVTEAKFAPFIEAANHLVNQCCLESDYSDATLELIERWLAAHFYHVFDPRRVQERADVISATFEGKTGLNLNFTRYGQQAMMLDTAGNLAALNDEITKGKKKIQGNVLWVGGGTSGEMEGP